jgi:hypothetical protein
MCSMPYKKALRVKLAMEMDGRAALLQIRGVVKQEISCHARKHLILPVLRCLLPVHVRLPNESLAAIEEDYQASATQAGSAAAGNGVNVHSVKHDCKIEAPVSAIVSDEKAVATCVFCRREFKSQHAGLCASVDMLSRGHDSLAFSASDSAHLLCGMLFFPSQHKRLNITMSTFSGHPCLTQCRVSPTKGRGGGIACSACSARQVRSSFQEEAQVLENKSADESLKQEVHRLHTFRQLQ